MTYIGNKIASKPKDDDHNLGHGKAEYIFSMLVSISMMLVSITLLKKLYKGLNSPKRLYIFMVACNSVSYNNISKSYAIHIHTFNG